MRVKFCGMTRLEDAREAARLGAWAIGLIHHRASPRFCEPAAAAEIGGALKRQLEVVGVFVNATLDEIVRAAEDEALTMVQLHGDEGPVFCQEAARRTGCRVIKAIRVRSAAEVQAASAYHTDFHLFDAHRSGLPGGSGESFDWELLRGRSTPIPPILSGGLRPENVGDGISATRPYAVDVATGVELRPGVKDHERMAAFFDAAQVAATRSGAIEELAG
jgi:phosphoribosylanthranilate isomerase